MLLSLKLSKCLPNETLFGVSCWGHMTMVHPSCDADRSHFLAMVSFAANFFRRLLRASANFVSKHCQTRQHTCQANHGLRIVDAMRLRHCDMTQCCSAMRCGRILLMHEAVRCDMRPCLCAIRSDALVQQRVLGGGVGVSMRSDALSWYLYLRCDTM